MLDSRHTIETPESIDLDIEPAGPIVRTLAFTIDLSIRMGIMLVAVIVLGYLDKLGFSLTLLLFFAMEWLYPVFFEVLGKGMTPGKRLMDITVIHDDGTPVGWAASTIRNLLRAVDILPVAYTFAYLTMALNKEFKRLGDLAAGTIVVYRKDIEHKTSKLQSQVVSTSLASPISLSLNEQNAIISFSERSHAISKERNKELANLLAPLVGSSGQDAVTRLHQIARGLTTTK